MRTRLLPLLLAACAALPGCERNRSTSGARGEIDPSRAVDERIQVDFNDASLKSSLRIERALSRVENGFLVIQVDVRNTRSSNLPCEWRTVFQDKDGFDLPVTSNPWTPVILNSNQTFPLAKTSPVSGAEKAVFYIREAAPIRK